MKIAYLQCPYETGRRESERIIEFKAFNRLSGKFEKRQVRVHPQDLFPTSDSFGSVRVAVTAEQNTTYTIRINVQDLRTTQAFTIEKYLITEPNS